MAERRAADRLLDRVDIAAEFQRTVMGGVERRRDLILGLVLLKNLGGERFGVVLGTIAQPLHVGVVPAAPKVVRDAVDHHEMIMRMVDAAADQLHHVAMADPGEKLARLDRPVGGAERANAQAGDGQAMFVGIQASQRLAEHLRHTVAGIRARLDSGVEETLPPVEADRVVRAREHDALDALAARGLEHVVAALDIHRQDLLPHPLHRDPPQMPDTIDAAPRRWKPTAWFELANTTRLTPWRRAASNTLWQPSIFIGRTFSHTSSTETPPRCTTQSMPDAAFSMADMSRRSAVTTSSPASALPSGARSVRRIRGSWTLSAGRRARAIC